MLHNRRLLAALLLSLSMGFVVVLLVRDRSFSEALPVVLVLLVVLAIAQYALLFMGGAGDRTLNQAQQAFLEGEFDLAARLLEISVQQQDTPSVKALTLLGNTYRMQNRMPESIDVLRRAVEMAPEDPFPLYGYGRALLVMGRYQDAVQYMEQALEYGARKATRVDLALARAYANDERLGSAAEKASRLLRVEPYRALMLNYLLYQLGSKPDVALQVMQNSAEGLAFWEAEARRYAETDYGQQLTNDIAQIKALLDSKEVSP